MNTTRWVYFDVDDTLILWKNTDAKKEKYHGLEVLEMDCPYGSTIKYKFYIHQAHIDLMRRIHTSGETVVVWSAGGYHWAKAVVEALRIEKYVDFVLQKPDTVVDDLKAEDILPRKALWINPK